MRSPIQALTLALLLLSPAAYALELSDTRINLLAGTSPTDGLLAIELQNQRHGISIAYPGNISYKYFFKADHSTQFVGAYYFQLNDRDTDKRIDGIQFDTVDIQSAGLAYGYRWRWLPGWNLTLISTIGNFTREYSRNDKFARGEETGIRYGFGINGGYRF